MVTGRTFELSSARALPATFVLGLVVAGCGAPPGTGGEGETPTRKRPADSPGDPPRRLDQVGGVQLVYRVLPGKTELARAHEQAVAVVRRRLEGIPDVDVRGRGTDEVVVSIVGREAERVREVRELASVEGRLRFQLPYVADAGEPAHAAQLPYWKGVADSGVLAEFASASDKPHVDFGDREEAKRFAEQLMGLPADHPGAVPRGFEVLVEATSDEPPRYRPWVLDTAVHLEEGVSRADVRMGELPPVPYVGVEFTPEAAKGFCTLTTRLQDQLIAVVVDDWVASVPMVREPICGGRARVDVGVVKNARREAERLALVLRSGALPAAMQLVEEVRIGPAG